LLQKNLHHRSNVMHLIRVYRCFLLLVKDFKVIFLSRRSKIKQVSKPSSKIFVEASFCKKKYCRISVPLREISGPQRESVRLTSNARVSRKSVRLSGLSATLNATYAISLSLCSKNTKHFKVFLCDDSSLLGSVTATFSKYSHKYL